MVTCHLIMCDATVNASLLHTKEYVNMQTLLGLLILNSDKEY
jgi:hypothetical protein